MWGKPSRNGSVVFQKCRESNKGGLLEQSAEIEFKTLMGG